MAAIEAEETPMNMLKTETSTRDHLREGDMGMYLMQFKANWKGREELHGGLTEEVNLLAVKPALVGLCRSKMIGSLWYISYSIRVYSIQQVKKKNK